eukprot:6189427-Pleurochrysis_carterae.AAC.6
MVDASATHLARRHLLERGVQRGRVLHRLRLAVARTRAAHAFESTRADAGQRQERARGDTLRRVQSGCEAYAFGAPSS